MTPDQVAHFLRKRTPYKIEKRDKKVVVWLDPWHGAVVTRDLVVRATIPDLGNLLWYLILVTVTCCLIELFWPSLHTRSAAVEAEIRELFRRELGIIVG